MKKLQYGISDSTIENISLEERIQLYKKIGFDFFSFNYTKNYEENLNYILLAKKYNIKIDDIHLDFLKVNDIWLYEKSEFLDYVKQSIDEISTFRDIGKDVILHISKTNTPPPINDMGINTFLMLDKYAKNKNVNLCFENLRKPDYLEKLIEKSNNTLNICFDIGHANLYMKDYFEFLKKYSKYIKTTHLHDNNKDFDAHISLYEGSIDWEKSINELLKAPTDKMHLEIHPSTKNVSKEEFEKFLSTNLSNLKKLCNIK